MPEIIEGELCFRFPDGWLVSKFDADDGFAVRKFQIDRTKKVDILALSPKPKLYIIEIKDFRGHDIENRDRLKTDGDDPLHVEVAEKVRDAISTLVAAFRSGDKTLKPFCEHLFGGRNREAEVILHLERDDARARTVKGHRSRADIQSKLKQLVQPYNFRCLVSQKADYAPWKVTGAPRAGGG